MSKLTINQVAFGSLKRRRGQYRSIIIGAGLAIFFVSSLLLFAQSIFQTQFHTHVDRKGYQDAIVFNAEGSAPGSLLYDSGMIAEIGNAYVLGVTEDRGCSVGYFDEAGAKLANLVLTEGRLPEQAGEMAVEPNFLQKLRMEANVGDDITIAIKIPNGVAPQFLPESVVKTYKIVGMLKPRTNYIHEWSFNDAPYSTYPGAIVSDAELIEPGGRAIVHRLVKFARGANFMEFSEYVINELNHYDMEDTSFNLLGYSRNSANIVNTMYYAVILGLVLVVAACQGIVNAFSANLSERRGQIGMMRAVGATSRQIRRIFGREVLLLTLIIAPVSVALSYLFVRGLTKWIEPLIFYVVPWFLPVCIAVSASCVALAAWIPLFGASRISPMQMIREVSLLRARKKVKVRQRREYNAPRLIAGRHLKLYRARQIGTAVMVALSIVIISLAGQEMFRDSNYRPSYGYEIYDYSGGVNGYAEVEASPSGRLLDADIDDILSLPLVSGVDTSITAHIAVQVDELTDYGVGVINGSAWTDEEKEYSYEESREFAKRMNLNRDVVSMIIMVCKEESFAALTPHVTDGKIDMDAINEGRELLLIAPETYYIYMEYDAEGNRRGGWGSDTPARNMECVKTYVNDMFRAGTPLDMIRLSTPAKNLKQLPDGSYDYVTGIRREDASASIGAILESAAGGALNSTIWPEHGTLITTHAGFAALGFERFGYSSLGVILKEEPDDETLAYLTEALEAITMRGANTQLYNCVQRDRDSKASATLFRISILSVLLLLISMCVSLVNHSITNRVRGDKRAIGTLRAVGAQLKDIVHSYQLQALAMIGWGILAGNILSAAFYTWLYFYSFYPRNAALKLPYGGIALVQAAFLILVGLFCGLNLSFRIREITRASIVDNIREL